MEGIRLIALQDPASTMNVGDDDEYEDVDDEEDANDETQSAEPPPYEFRISTAKLLIELGDHEVRAFC